MLAGLRKRVADGELCAELFKSRVLWHNAEEQLLVAITEGLMSARDDTMARNMYLHYSYCCNNDRYMSILFHSQPVYIWLKGDDFSSPGEHQQQTS